MRIIFLDVDGVLNSKNKLIEVYNKTHKPHSGFSYPFDEKCMENLKILLSNTKAKLVITSTWRRYDEGKEILLKELKKYGLDGDVIGYTPVLNGKPRGEEILTFLSTLNINVNFVILDDDSDMGILLPFLVKTDNQIGLSHKNVKEVISRFEI